MNINKNLDKILKSPLLSSGIFITTGAYKTYQDYKYADLKYKKHFLLKDTVVLTGAAVGLLGHKVAANSMVKSKIYNQITEKFAQKITPITNKKAFAKAVEHTKEIIGNTFFNFTMFFSGIMGALGMDYLLTLTGFHQPDKHNLNYINKPIITNNKLNNYIDDIDDNVSKIVDKQTQSEIYNRITDMPQMNIFTDSMIGVHALNLSKDKEFKKRLNHTTKCLLSNSLVPLFFLSSATTFTKNIKPMIRIPIIFTTLVCGTQWTNKLIDNYIAKQKE